ncbi:unnamed protein product [Moneuplotes crassus]|uniref:Cyclic nucleotide-binding domain-containing protein n=1 Tax=Euplotes crassus TaxID=5936 RepID=A0AAD1X827_EUPCR|nr:unnamed protein product [Moneuplotes crassus]
MDILDRIESSNWDPLASNCEEKGGTLEDNISILAADPNNRSKSQIAQLSDFFENNKNNFFSKLEKENGHKILEMIFKKIKLSTLASFCSSKSMDQDKYVIPKNIPIVEYGEYGDTFYIILKGRVSVRVPSVVESKMYTLTQLIRYLYQNFKYLIKDEEYEAALAMLKTYYPDSVKISQKGQVSLNYNYLEKKFEKHDSSTREGEDKNFQHLVKPLGLPQESARAIIEEEEEPTRPFGFRTLTRVAELGEGAGFGEVALLHKVPRTATITTLTDSIFAILEKKDFSSIMGRFYKSKLVRQVDLMDNFMVFKQLRESTKEKVCTLLKDCPTKFSSTILKEGDPIQNIYFITNGQFEITKTIYYKKNESKAKRKMDMDNITYTKYLSTKSDAKTFNPKLENVSHNQELDYKEFKKSTKGYYKVNSRLLSFEKFEIFGMVESIIGCPYSIVNLKCLSNDAQVYQISKEDFTTLFQGNTSVKKNIKQKLALMEERINLALEQLLIKLNEEFNKKDNNTSLNELLLRSINRQVIRSNFSKKSSQLHQDMEDTPSEIHEIAPPSKPKKGMTYLDLVNASAVTPEKARRNSQESTRRDKSPKIIETKDLELHFTKQQSLKSLRKANKIQSEIDTNSQSKPFALTAEKGKKKLTQLCVKISKRNTQKYHHKARVKSDSKEITIEENKFSQFKRADKNSSRSPSKSRVEKEVLKSSRLGEVHITTPKVNILQSQKSNMSDLSPVFKPTRNSQVAHTKIINVEEITPYKRKNRKTHRVTNASRNDLSASLITSEFIKFCDLNKLANHEDDALETPQKYQDKVVQSRDVSPLKLAQGLSSIVPVLITPQVRKGKKKLFGMDRTERINKLEMTTLKQSRKHKTNKSLENTRRKRDSNFNQPFKPNSPFKNNILEGLKLPNLGNKKRSEVKYSTNHKDLSFLHYKNASVFHGKKAPIMIDSVKLETSLSPTFDTPQKEVSNFPKPIKDPRYMRIKKSFKRMLSSALKSETAEKIKKSKMHGCKHGCKHGSIGSQPPESSVLSLLQKKAKQIAFASPVYQLPYKMTNNLNKSNF